MQHYLGTVISQPLALRRIRLINRFRHRIPPRIVKNLPHVPDRPHQRIREGKPSIGGLQRNRHGSHRAHHVISRARPAQIDHRRLPRKNSAVRHRQRRREPRAAPGFDPLVVNLQFIGCHSPWRSSRPVLRPRSNPARRCRAPSRARARISLPRALFRRQSQIRSRINQSRIHRQSRAINHPRLGRNRHAGAHRRNQSFGDHHRPVFQSPRPKPARSAHS